MFTSKNIEKNSQNPDEFVCKALFCSRQKWRKCFKNFAPLPQGPIVIPVIKIETYKSSPHKQTHVLASQRAATTTEEAQDEHKENCKKEKLKKELKA